MNRSPASEVGGESVTTATMAPKEFLEFVNVLKMCVTNATYILMHKTVASQSSFYLKNFLSNF